MSDVGTCSCLGSTSVNIYHWDPSLSLNLMYYKKNETVKVYASIYVAYENVSWSQ